MNRLGKLLYSKLTKRIAFLRFFVFIFVCLFVFKSSLNLLNSYQVYWTIFICPQTLPPPLSTLNPRKEASNVINYSQASLSSGFWLSSANGRHWQEMRGRRRVRSECSSAVATLLCRDHCSQGTYQMHLWLCRILLVTPCPCLFSSQLRVLLTSLLTLFNLLILLQFLH